MSTYVNNNSEVLVRDEPAGANQFNALTNGDWCHAEIRRQNDKMGVDSRYEMRYSEEWKEVLVDPNEAWRGYENEAFCCIERHLREAE